MVAVVACGSEPQASDTVYRVRIEHCVGANTQRATAVAVAPDLVVTVAHSFEEAETVTVFDRADNEVPVEIVHMDSDKDLAVLRLGTPADEVLGLSEPAETGPVTITTFGESDGPVDKDGEILELVQATLDGEGPRAAVRLAAGIKPGDSGAPVIDADGRMVAMVFATVRGKDVGWAVSSVEIVDALETIATETPGAIPLTCP